MRVAFRSRDRRELVAAVALLAVLACLALLTRWLPRAPLSADDSLYLAIATAIANGNGAVMPSGDPFTTRAPIYPTLLAAAISIFGPGRGPEAVRVLWVVWAAAALFLLGRAWYGMAAAFLAVLIAAIAPGVLALAASYRIDFIATAVALTGLWLFDRASATASTRLALAAGIVSAFGVLTKETSLVLAPAVVAIWDVRRPRDDHDPRPLFAFGVALAVTCAPWWAYHWAQTGRFFPTGLTAEEGGAALAAVALLGLVALLLLTLRSGWAARGVAAWSRRFERHRWLTPLIGLGGLVLWVLLVLAFIRLRPTDDVADVGARFATLELVPYLEPLWLAAVGSVVLIVRAITRRGVALAHLVTILCFAPIAARAMLGVWSARHLLLPAMLIDLASAALVVTVVTAVVRLLRRPGAAESSTEPAPAVAGQTTRSRALGITAGVLCVLLGAQLALQGAGSVRQAFAPPGERQALEAGWDVEEIRRTARWLLRNVERRPVILVSWLYGSQLYRLTRGRYRMPLIPTVETRLQPSGELFQPVSTLYRYLDHRFDPRSGGDDWIFLRKQAVEGYYVGLTQTALLDEIERRRADYVVISGEHPVQSTTTLRRVLRRLPGFVRVHDTGVGQPRLIVYELDRELLAPLEEPPPLLVDGFTFEELLRDLEAVRGLTPAEAVCQLGGARVTIVPFDEADEAALAHLEALLEEAEGCPEPAPAG